MCALSVSQSTETAHSSLACPSFIPLPRTVSGIHVHSIYFPEYRVSTFPPFFPFSLPSLPECGRHTRPRVGSSNASVAWRGEWIFAVFAALATLMAHPPAEFIIAVLFHLLRGKMRAADMQRRGSEARSVHDVLTLRLLRFCL